MLQTDEKRNVLLQNVLLRVIEEHDAADLLRLYSNPRVTRYLPLKLDTLAEAAALARELSNSWLTHGFGMWAILDLQDMNFIGRCGFFDRPSADSTMPSKELAYLIDERYWGRGIATECAVACLRYAFTAKDFHSVYAITKNENVASRRVLEKSGMISSPREPFNSLVKTFYSISRSEYRVTNQPFKFVEYRN